MASTLPTLTTLSCSFIKPSIIHVELNRPKNLNSMNKALFSELKQLFTALNQYEDLRVVVLTGSGKCFTAGLDLVEAPSIFLFDEQMDQARKSIQLYNLIRDWQESLSSILKLKVPVIVGIHSFCIGGGVDLISGCDIRFCTEDAKFSIKEVDIGMCADIGTFPRISQIMANDSLIRELAFTGRTLTGPEALKHGLVSSIFKDKDEMVKAMLKMAESISEKSPIAIYNLKKVMNAFKVPKMEKGLEYVALTNMSQLFTNDVGEAMTASLTKQKAKFSKL